MTDNLKGYSMKMVPNSDMMIIMNKKTGWWQRVRIIV